MKAPLRLLETIKVENGKAFHLSYHQKRMDKARQQLWSQTSVLSLKDIIIPQHLGQGLFKWRLVYGEKEYKYEFLPYSPKPIQCLQLVEANGIMYDFKYENRDIIKHLKASKKKKCDDILIVKNGEITDISFANITFFDGKKWVTPKNPLLEGTQRARLLEEERVQEMRIRPQDLHLFSSFKIINAMLDFEKTESISIRNIYQSAFK